LPLGFLLTMYTFTGYDASAHLSEETHDAERAAPRGLWTSIAYSAVGGWALLLALTFAATHVAAINAGGGGAIPIIESALSTGLAKLVLDISTIGQLFCGMGCVAAASRMVFAFSRDGAVPGHATVATPQQAPDADVGGAVRGRPRAHHHDPGTVRQQGRFPGGLLRGHVDHDDRALHRLHPAGLPPLADGDKFEPGVWNLGKHYKWINVIAIVWVVICVVIFCLPTGPAAVPWDSGFNWSDFNYAPLVTIALALGVWIAWVAGAKNTFKGPVRTVDDPDVGTPRIRR
jgi:amino acid transporter